jgi:hypothetical protein
MLSTTLRVLRMAWRCVVADKPLEMRTSQRLASAQAYFERNLDRLLAEFPGEYVAIVDDAVVFHNHDLGEVTKHVYTQYKQRPIFIERVEPAEEILLPSPTS